MTGSKDEERRRVDICDGREGRELLPSAATMGRATAAMTNETSAAIIAANGMVVFPANA